MKFGLIIEKVCWALQKGFFSARRGMSPCIIRKPIVIFIALLPFTGFAQFNIKGKVLNQADKKPVDGASVFINNTTIGVVTAANGGFVLSNLTPGKYKLVVTTIGFGSATREVTISNSDVSLGDISLKSVSIGLAEVKITAKKDAKWSDYFELFRHQFLGESDAAQQCTILNPDVLDLHYNDATKTLSASTAPDLLQIENDALGYKIKYRLDDFTYRDADDDSSKFIQFKGDVFYEPLSGTASEQRRWQRNRQAVYANSAIHFFQALMAGQLGEEGFRVVKISETKNPDRPADSLIKNKLRFFKSQKSRYARDSLSWWTKKSELPVILYKLIPAPLTSADLIRVTQQPGLYTFGHANELLYVTYNKSGHFLNPPRVSPYLSGKKNIENTLITFNSPYTLINQSGAVVNPFDMSYDGVWARNRVAELLPTNYENVQLKNPDIGYTKNDSLFIGRNIKALQSYSATHPVEKVHLHIDRQVYFPGDTAWFNAYLVLGPEHKLSSLSKLMYAELIDPKDSVVKRLSLGLEAGIAAGDFKLHYDIKPGRYHIRAYTNWMRNFGPEYFFDQAIVVSGFGTTLAGTGHAASGSPGKVDLQFFPEGGSLVNGLRSKVAFKAVNQDGVAVEVQGSIVDNSGTQVADFSSQHLGMGVFPLSPEAGKQYAAKVTAADGSTFTVPLPSAENGGMALAVNNNLPDSVYIRVAVRNIRDSVFYLIAQSGGKQYFAATGKLSGKPFSASIARERFPTGIVQFTLFGQNGEPLNERIVFIQNDDQLHLTITADKSAYAPGDPADLNIEATDANGTPATGSFSVSVVDESKVPVNETAENTILSDILLKSEIKGYIQDPGYYFVNPNEQTKADLDLLMLTQGYRRFEWKKILSDSTAAMVYTPEQDFDVSGKVTTPGGKPIVGGKVFFTSPKHMIVLDTLTDANGRFSFNNLQFTDSVTAVINAKKANGGSHVDLTIDKFREPAILKSSGSVDGYFSNQFNLTAKQLKSAYTSWRRDSLEHVIQLKEVTIKEHKSTSSHPDYAALLKHSTNLNGPGQADQVILGSEMTTCPTLADCILYHLRGGVTTSIDRMGNTIFYSTNVPGRFVTHPPPMRVVVNGSIPIDPSEMAMISPIEVESVELLESPMYYGVYGSAGTGGVILVTLKYGDEADYILPAQPGLTVYHSSGFYKARSFYSPRYDAAKKVSLADDRKTIYWQPAVITDADGRAHINYFNGAATATYRVVIEGIDGDGKLGFTSYRYQVTGGQN